MEYRSFGSTNCQVSALGFGCMRLPTLGDDNGKIDEPQAINMIRAAIDQGVNYIDTAWGYHREQSEPLVGKALSDGYREKVHLATKLPSWLIHSQGDMKHYLSVQLERLQTDHIDFYLLHTLNARYWQNYVDLRVFDWAEKEMASGRIRHLGFSFHDEYPVFERILNGYDHWDFCQIQYNYMDVAYQAGERGLRAAAEKGLGVVVMEPLRGGSLASPTPPPPVAKAFSQSQRDWTPVEWALQWLWNQPEVSLVLSGMSNPIQTQQNITSAGRSGVGKLTADDLAVMANVQEAWNGLAPVPCTHCEYCMPCAHGVQIPEVFRIYNTAAIYDNRARGRDDYKNAISDDGKADCCVECGECEALCPQHIEIIQKLKDAHVYLSPEVSG